MMMIVSYSANNSVKNYEGEREHANVLSQVTLEDTRSTHTQTHTRTKQHQKKECARVPKSQFQATLSALIRTSTRTHAKQTHTHT